MQPTRGLVPARFERGTDRSIDVALRSEHNDAMARKRPFRFGMLIGASELGASADIAQLIEKARKAEALGYSVGLIPDHVGDQFAALPALAAVAARTESLRLGPYMLNNDLRHPAVLAQELATVDQISDGRLEIGIGAGWNVREYRCLDLEFDRPRVRHERLREAVQVIRGALSGEAFSFEGEHYRIDAMVGRPLPVQRPCPPIAIGGGGRRTLEFAAATGDIVGIAPRFSVEGKADFGSLLRDATQEQLEWIRNAAGSRFENIELTVFTNFTPPVVTDNPEQVAADLTDALHKRNPATATPTARQLLESPHVFIGTVNALVEKCFELRETLGISYIAVTGNMEGFAPIVQRMAGA